MPSEIRPTTPEELPEVAGFLVAGFGAPADAEFAALDVLRWKYFDPIGVEGPRSFLARDGGAIVGHIGIDRTSFHVVDQHGRREVPAVHMMDWLGSPSHPSVGAYLMRRVHSLTKLQYGVGGQDIAQKVGSRSGGCRIAPELPVFRKVLRPSYRLRTPGEPPARRLLAAARDVARAGLARLPRPRAALALRPVAAFGAEVDDVLARLEGPLVHTDRRPVRLNHRLAYPRGGMSGWLVVDGRGQTLGFALLNEAVRDGVRVGRVAECLLAGADPDTWHAAFVALGGELHRRRADVAVAWGPTPRVVAGLEAAGFARTHAMPVVIRDRAGQIPTDYPLHLSYLESDYAVV